MSENESTFNDFKDVFKRACRLAINETLREGMIQAIYDSSGPYTEEDLREMDYPYAKRHGEPQLPPEIINAQRGVFRESWDIYPATASNSFNGVLINDSDVADFLNEGTDVMFDRPIEHSLSEFMEEYLEKALERRLNDIEL